MKLEEMADVLDGLANTLEKLLGKSALNDLRAVSACFRKFPGENVTTFCNYIVQAREGKTTTRRTAAAVDQVKVDEQVAKVQHYLDHRHTYDYPAIRQIAQQIGKLKVPEIQAVGERIGCPLSEKKKAAMVERLEKWLTNIKLSADQSSFSLTGTR